MYSVHLQEYTQGKLEVSALLLGLVAIALMFLFAFILIDVFWVGIDNISWAYLTQTPLESGRAGGIGPVLVSTLLILAVCLVVTVPLGLGTAVLLAEYLPLENPLGWFVRRTLDILAGVPSIVIGLFGNAFFCVQLGLGFSILSGGLTLACMVLPIFIRASEDGFRCIDDSYRHNASALGLTQVSTIRYVLFPMALPAIAVGLSLSVGRALAETAALIFTSGYVDRMPDSLLESGRALSIHIFDLSMNVPGGDSRAYSAALVLLVLIVSINVTTQILMRSFLKRRIVNV
ncbi:MAG: phosphate ABC transporter permease PstA [Gammaproteobacteria bacterium]|nr:phosphate ABC transporter permease PstA [Gammaproteobacteria bacterium]MDH5802885.1 phosphate ABC transporter permease PstA [Gammaproteobacteria bacterium]